MENLIRRYENQLRRVNNARAKNNEATRKFNQARNNFMNKYHIPENTKRFNESFVYVYLPKHPEIKPYHRNVEQAKRVLHMEQNRLRQIVNQLRRHYHMPNTRYGTINLNNVLRNYYQRRRNKSRALIVSNAVGFPKSFTYKLLREFL